MTTPVQLTYPGATVDTLLETVNGSNLSATHKITRSATIVVAASDSSAKSKAQADYVCDGIDDQVEIQAAINALPDAGGKILLLEGRYIKGNSAAIDLPSNTIFESLGTIIIKPDAGNIPYILKCDSVDNVKIIGGVYDGNNNNHTTITGNAYNIYFINTTNSEINHVTSQNAGTTADSGYSIYINGCTNISVHDCIDINALHSAYTIYSGCTHINLYNNFSINSQRHGFNVHNVSKCNISNNIVYGGSRGITFAGTVTDVNFVSNFISGTTSSAVGLYGTSFSRLKIDYNTIISCGRSTSQPAIFLDNTATNTSASGNSIYDAYMGIGLYGTYLTANGNCIYGSATGIYVTGTRCSIQNNMLHTTTTYGIWVNGGANNTICENGLNDCHSPAIYLVNADNTLIRNNIFTTTSGGIYVKIDVNSSSCIATNNKFYDVGTINIIIDNYASDTVISKNNGYATENTGTATITSTATTVNVTHGLAAAPTRVLLSPTTATAGKQFYVSAKAATTFTITIDSAAEADISFDWQAVV